MAHFIQEALDKTLRWGKENGLTFNPTKTTTVLFTRSRRAVKEPKLTMDGKNLEYSNEMKYLGVTIQKRLSWTTHVSERTKKAGRLLNMVQNVIGQNWGLDPDKVLWTHTAIVRPKVCYAAMVWATSIGTTMSKKMEQLQRKVLLGASAAMRSTPTAAMEAIMGLPPMDLFALGEAMKARARTRGKMRDTWDGLNLSLKRAEAKGHRRVLDDALRQLVEVDNMEETPNERSTVEWKEVESDLEMVTDGACRDGEMGFAWTLYDGPSVVAAGSGHGGKGSPYRAELVGLDDALLWLISNPHRLRGRKLNLTTDCKSAVEALKGTKVKDAAVKGILDKAKILSTLGDIGLKWVQRNEGEKRDLVDAMARQASLRDPLSPEAEALNILLEGKYHARDKNPRYTPVMLAEVKQLVNQRIIEIWQDRWASSGQTTARRFFPKVNGGGLKKLRGYSRRLLNELFQFGTGHGLFGGHLRHWREIDGECLLCLEEEETSAHLMWECPALAWWREADAAEKMEERIFELARIEAVVELRQTRETQIKG
jgi:hypothetical protein